MSEITYRGNLSASQFPLSSNWQGRSVIVGGPDQSYVRGLQVPQEGLINENDKGIATAQYMHNMMPTGEGFQSVDFDNIVGNIAGPPAPATLYTLYSNLANPLIQYFTLIPGTLNAWVLKQVAGVWTWVAVTNLGVADYAGSTVSTATVNGQTYLYLSASATPLRYVDAAANLVSYVPAINIGTKFGMTAAFGYLILWDANAVYWSSTISISDFTVSLVTGAGFEGIQPAKGQIRVCVPHELGFMIFCDYNIVMATYTGNKNFPWKFDEISHAGGYNSLSAADITSHLASDTTAENYYVYGTSGLQLVGQHGAVTTLPDITDFLSGRLFEDFDTGTRLFTRTILATGARLNIRIALIADRYLVISYGLLPNPAVLTPFTHAIVYDTINKRMGKLKLTHICAFEFFQSTNLALQTNPQPKYNIGFMQQGGAVKVINFAQEATAADSVVMLGKFQEIRSRLITMERLDIESPYSGSNLLVYLYTSLDGKNPTTVPPVAATSQVIGTDLRTYTFHKTGINHTLVFIGGMYLTTFILKFHRNGKR